MICPFTIAIDTAEQFAFPFVTMKADADKNYQPIEVITVARCLGRYPNSFGDYSIDGAIGKVAIERKSIDDLYSTLLGFADGHRERFECELQNLSQCCSVVIVEGTLAQCVLRAPEHGKRTAAQNAKSLFRSIIALQQDYRVPWMFCDSRELAEQAAFRFLWRYWEKNLKVTRSRKAAKVKTSVSDLLANV